MSCRKNRKTKQKGKWKNRGFMAGNGHENQKIKRIKERNCFWPELLLYWWKMKAIEFFAGIGGLHTALKVSDPESTVTTAYDINPNASLVYFWLQYSGCADHSDFK